MSYLHRLALQGQYCGRVRLPEQPFSPPASQRWFYAILKITIKKKANHLLFMSVTTLPASYPLYGQMIDYLNMFTSVTQSTSSYDEVDASFQKQYWYMKRFLGFHLSFFVFRSNNSIVLQNPCKSLITLRSLFGQKRTSCFLHQLKCFFFCPRCNLMNHSH